MDTVYEAMFAIGGNVRIPDYRGTKYEPLDVFYENQKEVGRTGFFLVQLH